MSAERPYPLAIKWIIQYKLRKKNYQKEMFYMITEKKTQTNHTKFRPCNCDALSGSTGVNTMSIQHTYLLRAAINYPHEKAALPDFNDKV